MLKNQSPSTRTLWFKPPYLRQIRLKKTPYIVRLEDNLAQWEGKTIALTDGRRTIFALVKQAKRLPIDKINFFIIDSLGFKTRAHMLAALQQMAKKDYLVSEVTILEVTVQHSDSLLKPTEGLILNNH